MGKLDMYYPRYQCLDKLPDYSYDIIGGIWINTGDVGISRNLQ